jgi:hypothetical protein
MKLQSFFFGSAGRYSGQLRCSHEALQAAGVCVSIKPAVGVASGWAETFNIQHFCFLTPETWHLKPEH